MDQICPRRAFPVKSIINLGTNFQLTTSKFWTKSAQKGHSDRNQKSEHGHWILHIKISLGIKFDLKLKILIFLDQIIPKKVFPAENERIEYRHWIVRISISLSIKPHLKLKILIFWTKFAQKVYSRSKPESEHHHWILLIRISVGTKFQLKLIILTFWTKFTQKGYFWSKTKNVNTTIEFCIFELVKASNFSLNW